MRKILFFCFLFLSPDILFSQNTILSFAKYTNDDFSSDNGCMTKVNSVGIEIIVKAGKNTVSFEVADSVHEKLSDYRSVVFDVANTGSNKCRVNIWLVEKSWINSSVTLSPGEEKPLQVDLSRRSPKKDEYFKVSSRNGKRITNTGVIINSCICSRN